MNPDEVPDGLYWIRYPGDEVDSLSHVVTINGRKVHSTTECLYGPGSLDWSSVVKLQRVNRADLADLRKLADFIEHRHAITEVEPKGVIE